VQCSAVSRQVIEVTDGEQIQQVIIQTISSADACKITTRHFKLIVKTIKGILSQM
jgi:hypothetical protein